MSRRMKKTSTPKLKCLSDSKVIAALFEGTEPSKNLMDRLLPQDISDRDSLIRGVAESLLRLEKLGYVRLQETGPALFVTKLSPNMAHPKSDDVPEVSDVFAPSTAKRLVSVMKRSQ